VLDVSAPDRVIDREQIQPAGLAGTCHATRGRWPGTRRQKHALVLVTPYAAWRSPSCRTTLISHRAGGPSQGAVEPEPAHSQRYTVAPAHHIRYVTQTIRPHGPQRARLVDERDLGVAQAEDAVGLLVVDLPGLLGLAAKHDLHAPVADLQLVRHQQPRAAALLRCAPRGAAHGQHAAYDKKRSACLRSPPRCARCSSASLEPRPHPRPGPTSDPCKPLADHSGSKAFALSGSGTGLYDVPSSSRR